MRRNVAKFIVLGALLLLMPISLMLGRRWRTAGYYQWKNTPGENILLPDEVSGQRGSEVCASYDGQFIAVAGNRVIPSDMFEKERGVESAIHLLCYKYFVYVSRTFGKNFDCVYRGLNSGGVASMALSPTNPNRLAFVAAEFQKAVPETANEIMQMIRDPSGGKELGMEYVKVLQARDLRIVMYILDLDKNELPRILCTFGNFPYSKILKLPKTDLSGIDELRLKMMSESESFRETGVFVPWRLRLNLEIQTRFITWLPNGNELLAADGCSITKIDPSGNKFPFYTNENALIVGNLFCNANGDVSFVELDRSGNNASSYLTRLDTNGSVLSKTQVVFSMRDQPFDEVPLPLVGENKIATTGNKPENMHGAFLRISSLSSDLDNGKDRAKIYDIYDPNRVQFYYIPKVFLNNEKDVLLFKRRAYGLSRPAEHPNWEVTPYAPENAAAPWVELRKIKIT